MIHPRAYMRTAYNVIITEKGVFVNAQKKDPDLIPSLADIHSNGFSGLHCHDCKKRQPGTSEVDSTENERECVSAKYDPFTPNPRSFPGIWL